jgi:hypothetical protein
MTDQKKLKEMGYMAALIFLQCQSWMLHLQGFIICEKYIAFHFSPCLIKFPLPHVKCSLDRNFYIGLFRIIFLFMIYK